MLTMPSKAPHLRQSGPVLAGQAGQAVQGRAGRWMTERGRGSEEQGG